ncbi:MAG TPA: tyrosine-protein phosphatase [Pyrinomonadaceae bacterium]|jgi:protein tyrosine/serine phosphatase|nr:tyrosine-protein phosphatase [Pyrinomonadaceae bacterium]
MKRIPSYRLFLFNVTAILALVIGTAVVSLAQAHPSTPVTKIKNFGQMNDRFFRGGQPKEKEYKDLAAMGVHTIIDLRDDPESYEKPNAEALGMTYVNIPMSDKDYPKSDQITAFLKLVDDPATGKFYVHCAGGRHRTGVMGAVYRFTHDKWNYDQAYAEMKQYDFYTRFGHGAMKKYVEDYWQQMQSAPTPAATAGAASPKK